MLIDERIRTMRCGCRYDVVTQIKTYLCERHRWVCPHCGARWQDPPKPDRRTAKARRLGRAERRKRPALRCCQAQPGVER